MSEHEKKAMQETADIYKRLPPYLQGKIDGYAEAVKEKKNAAAEEKPGK